MKERYLQYDYEWEEQNHRRGIVFSIIMHLFLFLLFLIPILTFPDPPLEQHGVYVTFGEPDQGSKPEAALAAAVPLEEAKPAEPQEATPPTTEKIVEQSSAKSPSAASPPKSSPTKKVQSTQIQEKAPVVAVEEVPVVEEDHSVSEKAQEKAEQRRLEEEQFKQAEADRKAKELAEQDRLEKQRVQQEREARERADKLAKEKAERERQEREAQEKREKYESSKRRFDDVFNKGQGSNSAEGNEGIPEGEPDASILKGQIQGSGNIGGGLGNRGLLYEPSIEDRSQKQGRVVIKVCVNASGSVSSARFTQRGSTTTDTQLVDKAIEAARKYKFTESELDEQCGTITVDFKLK